MSKSQAAKLENMNTGLFRLSFPFLFEKRPPMGKNGEARTYECCALIPKKDVNQIKMLRQKLFEVAVAQWGQDRAKWPANLRHIKFSEYFSTTRQDGFPIGDGDATDFESHKGCIFLKFTSTNKPEVVDKYKMPVLNKEEAPAGLICRANVTPAAYLKVPEVSPIDGVKFYLNCLQIVKDDGVRYSGGPKAEAVFADAPAEDGDYFSTDDETVAEEAF